MAWNDNLIGTALSIAMSPAKRLRVMAGPGTGKSHAMMHRIARLLADGQDPSRIFAVTFTRNAAAGLKNDLKELNVPGSDRIRASTLHGFCFSLLRKSPVFHFLQRTPRPLMKFEVNVLLQDMKSLKEFGGKRECDRRLEAFEAAWARLQSDEPGWPSSSAGDQRFHAVLMQWMRFHEAMHIGEVVPLALEYLKNNPESPDRSAFDHVIADEYQDFNKAEQTLVAYLAEAGHCAVVGDVDQSIYRFRFANPEGIEEFSQMHPGTEDESLDECRRCPKRVVAMADSLIRRNHPPGTSPRLRECEKNPTGNARIVQWSNLEEETAGIVEFVETRLATGRYSPEDFMILCPSRKIGYELRQRLIDKKINAHSFYSEESLDAPEAQHAFALLTLLANPEDRVALRFLLGEGSKTFLAVTYAKLIKYCRENAVSPSHALAQVASGELQLRGVDGLVARYRKIRLELEALNGIIGQQLVDTLFPEESEWTKSVRESMAGRFDETVDAKTVLEELIQVVTQRDLPDDGKFVRIMSLHKSKGLKSRVVIVVGCIQGLLPKVDDSMSEQDSEEDLREQRRLFYVAMTRATDELLLSSAIAWPWALAKQAGIALRASRGRGEGSTIASIFLNELGSATPSAITGKQLLQSERS
ncbi:MAG: ATP-dependent helicase [Patescibacteria group bacterium]|jgi:superfamily I DNA/RNA helicase